MIQRSPTGNSISATPTISAIMKAAIQISSGNEPALRNGRVAAVGRLTTELVPNAPDSHDMFRFRRVALDLLAQPPNMDRDRTLVGDVLGSPDSVEQLVTREHLTRVTRQKIKEVEF